MIHGFLPVRKEAGFTSHDTVAVLRGILHQRKIGHTGTLDPNATGVLPVGLGIATRACPLLPDKRKTYLAEMTLGIQTDTEDIWGTVLRREDAVFSEASIREAAASFIGTILQVPPMYSAKKQHGKKLIDLARQGITVEREAVPVTIWQLDILRVEGPRAVMRVTCSAGTYIRTLCADIGKKLGTAACMSSLVRESACGFDIANALTLKEIESLRDAGTLHEHIIPVDRALSCYEALRLPMSLEKALKNGNPFPAEPYGIQPGAEQEDIRRIYLDNGLFIGLYRPDRTGRFFTPLRMFLDSSGED